MLHSNPKARIQSLEFAKEDVLELKLISSTGIDAVSCSTCNKVGLSKMSSTHQNVVPHFAEFLVLTLGVDFCIHSLHYVFSFGFRGV